MESDEWDIEKLSLRYSDLWCDESRIIGQWFGCEIIEYSSEISFS